MHKGKSKSERIFELECQLKHLQRQLDLRTQQLTDKENELAATAMWKRVFQGRYEYYQLECDRLTKANEELKHKIRELEVALKAFKSVIDALKRKVG